MKKKVSLILTALIAAGALAGCGNSDSSSTSTPAAASTSASASKEDAPAAKEDAVEITLAHSSPDTVPMHQAAVEFGELVAEKTNGGVNVSVYPNSALGSEREAIEAVQFGNIQMVICSSSPVVNFAPDYYLFDFPFPFADRETAWEVLDSETGKKVFNAVESVGMKCLAVMENGFRNVSCNDEKHTPEDFKGLKIRTMENDVHMAMWKAIGSNPTPMAMGEVYTALQQKTIDAQENPLFQIEASRFYEVNKAIIEIRHIFTPYTCLTNTEFFDSLSAENQTAIVEALEEAAVHEKELSVEQEDKSRENLIANGCTVVQLTDEERQLFIDAVNSAAIDDMIIEKCADKDLAKEFQALVRQ